MANKVKFSDIKDKKTYQDILARANWLQRVVLKKLIKKDKPKK